MIEVLKKERGLKNRPFSKIILDYLSKKIYTLYVPFEKEVMLR